MISTLEFENRYLLGVEAMDVTHREFVALINELSACDRTRFIELFPALVAHTRTHFAAEEGIIERSAFPAIVEHRADHARVLGDLQHFAAALHRGKTQLTQAYVIDQLPRWFDLHAATMDRALAQYVSNRPPVKAILIWVR